MFSLHSTQRLWPAFVFVKNANHVNYCKYWKMEWKNKKFNLVETMEELQIRTWTRYFNPLWQSCNKMQTKVDQCCICQHMIPELHETHFPAKYSTVEVKKPIPNEKLPISWNLNYALKESEMQKPVCHAKS